MPVNHVLLETINLTQSATSVTFDNIPQTGYTDLVIKGSTRTNRSDAVNDFFKILPNGSSSSWTARFLQGTGSSSASYTQSVASNIAGETNGGLSTANIYGSFELYIPNYTSTNKYKSLFSASSMENNATVGISNILTGLWSNTNAITSLTFTPGVGSNWLAYSTFSLYGIAATGTSPSFGPKAQGGNIVANDGTYWYHAFLTSGTFTPTVALTSDILQVAGGGGANNDSSGGGGAGGLLTFTSQSLTATNYSVTVGAGGAYVTNGSNSQFGALTASIGGGRAGGNQSSPVTGANGGSGGGGYGGGTTTAGTGTVGQGNNGGAGFSSASPYGGGGGGGAGAAGNAGRSASDGAGGIGLTSSLLNAMGLATTTGQLSSGNYYYAGGGGGNGGLSTAGVGGLGGGGNGGSSADNSVATNGTVGTGGGAGGGNSVNPRSGGSGIVIIRYAMA